MVMSSGQQVRQACLEALRQVTQNEQRAKQALDTADRRRQQAIQTARESHRQARQRADDLLGEINAQAANGNRVLADLRLAPGAGTPPSFPPAAGAADLIRLLEQQARLAREAGTSLQTTGAQLKIERAKWWKFW
jgi:hypothetical protein